MMISEGTDDLLGRADDGDNSAIWKLLELHRARLRRMVAARLHRQLRSRVDPSDVVQELLADASRKLPDYLRERPLPYYLWLRKLTEQRLIWWYRFHVRAGKRSVVRNRIDVAGSGHANLVRFIEQLQDTNTSASGRLIRDEQRQQVLQTLDRLEPSDREVLRLRYFQGLSLNEVADALGISLGAAKMRHLRALQRLNVNFVGHEGEVSR